MPDTAESAFPQPAGGRAPVFATTYWPAVRSAATPGPERDAALGHLVTQYTPALKRYLRNRFKFDPATADDIVQSFLLDKVLKRNLLARAAEDKGKFRTFLLTSIHNCAMDYLRHLNAAKRRPASGRVALDDLRDSDPALAAEDTEAFDNLFLQQVLVTAVRRLYLHCSSRGLESAWAVFYHRVLAPSLDLADPVPYPTLAEELDLATERECRNRLVTAKRAFRHELESVVAEYTTSSAEAKEELIELRKLLG